MGLHVYYIQRKPKKKRKSKVTRRREEDELSMNEPYELEEKINDMVSTPLEGPQEGPTTTQDGILMMYQWNRDEEDLIKKKNFVLLLKCQQLMCHVDKPARQLNKGRASVVDTAPESSRLLHWNCTYSSIYT